MFLQFNVTLYCADYKISECYHENVTIETRYFSFSNTCNFVIDLNDIKYIIL